MPQPLTTAQILIWNLTKNKTFKNKKVIIEKGFGHKAGGVALRYEDIMIKPHNKNNNNLYIEDDSTESENAEIYNEDDLIDDKGNDNEDKQGND